MRAAKGASGLTAKNDEASPLDAAELAVREGSELCGWPNNESWATIDQFFLSGERWSPFQVVVEKLREPACKIGDDR